jgi:serine protease AprX
MTGTATVPRTPQTSFRLLASALILALLATAAGVTAATPAIVPQTDGGGVLSVDPAVEAAVTATGGAAAIVQLRPGTDATAAMHLVERTGGIVTVSLPIIDGFAAYITSSGLAALRDRTDVRTVTLDGSVTLAHDPPLGEQDGDHTYDRAIEADGLHQAGFDGSGIGIAIVDTGVTEVTDLTGRIVGGVDLTSERNGFDSYGHGTFIAGIAAGDGSASNGKFAGIAPGAHVIPIKIAGRDGAADISHVLAAMQYAVSFKDEYGIRILNLSLGTDSTQPNAVSPLNYAVERAWDSGIVVVVSAGNRGEEGPGRIPKPADDPLVITVGAIDANGTPSTVNDTVASYSSRGPSIADGIQKPDIIAPGSHLVAPKSPGSAVDVDHPEARIRDAYMRASGTSFAAGVTSGAIALLLEKNPTWTPDQVKGAILATARPGPVGDPNVDGAGILDIDAASALATPPVANVDAPRSTGLGLLGPARGTLEMVITDPVTGLHLILSGELTAQNLVFDPVTYTASSWWASSWWASSWWASSWWYVDDWS